MIKILALAALVALAGCIEMPETSEGSEFEAAAAPETDHIDGMTAEENHEDRIVACNDGGGLGLRLPPEACAERALSVTGRIGLDRLLIDLSAENGAIVIDQADGDAWSFEATYRVSALTEDEARAALDTAWSWSHEENGAHRLRAGPTPTAPGQVTGFGSPRVIASSYHVTLPAWVEIDLDAETDNGDIIVRGFQMGVVDAETDNGGILLRGSARDVDAQTDNGQIALDLTPLGGTFDLSSDNGQISVDVPVGARYGYDVEATTDNGQISIDLGEGDLHADEDGTTFVSDGFGSRNVRTKMTATTDNGQIGIR